jgi:hypothetical protein
MSHDSDVAVKFFSRLYKNSGAATANGATSALNNLLTASWFAYQTHRLTF